MQNHTKEWHVTFDRLVRAMRKVKDFEGPSDLSRLLDESPQNITNWMKRGVSKDGMIKAQGRYGIRADWVKTEIGDMFLTMPPGSYLVSEDKLASVPVLGKGMGGMPDRVFTDEGLPAGGSDDYAEIYSADRNAFVVRVDGSSMYPKYVHGEYALVEPNTAPEIEDDVILKTKNGQVMIKRLVSKRNGVHLASYNDPVVYMFQPDEIIWMYYVAYPVPARKIKTRI
jgi:SOS-response transcriptional repressor LexA